MRAPARRVDALRSTARTAVLRRLSAPGTTADRLRALGDLAAVAQSGRPLRQVAQGICDLAVQRLVDLSVIDAVGPDAGLLRLGATFSGDQRLLAALLACPPSTRGADVARPSVPLPDVTVHIPRLEPGARARLPYGDREVELLTAMALESVVVVPLISRGRPFGRLLLATSAGRRPLRSQADLDFATTFAGRAALALENAVLSDELSSRERELEAILEAVDAAITVRDSYGRMVYANQAAAELLGLPDVAAAKANPPGRLMDLFDVYSEAGDPISLAELPGTRVLAGEPAPPAMTVRNVIKGTGEERWLLNKATAVTGADGRVLMAVNLIEDVTDTKRTEIAQRLLAVTARQVAQLEDPTEAFQTTTAAAVPSLADWAGVDVVDPLGRIMPLAIAHRDPEKVRLGHRLREEWPATIDDTGGIAQVIRTGAPELISEVTEAMLELGARDSEHLEVLRAVGLNSIMITPILGAEHILGALSFVSSTARRFDQRDLDLACDLGRQLGLLISNAQLHAEQARIARTLQAGLFPQSLAPVEGWSVSSAYRAAGRANEVGGDFYDIVRFEGGWAAIIGDVLGKGAAAASLTALARHTVAALVESNGDVAHALQVLNRRLLERSPDFRSLCTLAVVASCGGVTQVYSAGHPLPLLVGGGVVRQVGVASPMLGFLDAIDIVATPVEVAPGERIVLYTDGVLDAVGIEGRFGERGLADAAQQAAEQADESPAKAIMEAIDAFVAGEQTDDIAILSLTRARVPAASRS